MNREEHLAAFRQFEIDRLLKLLHIEAKKNHDGHYTIFSFTSHFKVAFDTPFLLDGTAWAQVAQMPGHPTLKEALVHALVDAKCFWDYFDGDTDAWMIENSADALTPSPNL
jgi:hypothetical protein